MYEDNLNKDIILSGINDFLPEKLIEILNENYPDLITTISDSYGKHLPIFTKNWEKICEDIFKCDTQKIILVNFIPLEHTDPKYKVINNIYSKLTKCGYIIRKNTDFIPCNLCNKIILGKTTCDTMNVSYSENCIFYDEKFNEK